MKGWAEDPSPLLLSDVGMLECEHGARSSDRQRIGDCVRRDVAEDEQLRNRVLQLLKVALAAGAQGLYEHTIGGQFSNSAPHSGVSVEHQVAGEFNGKQMCDSIRDRLASAQGSTQTRERGFAVAKTQVSDNRQLQH